MFGLLKPVLIAGVVALSNGALADTSTILNGGDIFVAGAQVSEPVTTGGDAFLAGRTLQARGAIAGDLHVSGFDVSVIADTAEDLYAAGATVIIRGAVGEDLTAAAFSLRTEQSALTQGNARMIGNTVTIEGPVNGALSVTGRDVILNASVSGDARILAQTLTFGPDAVIDGTLTYVAEDRVAVPERVAPASRVVFEPFAAGRMWEEWDEIGRDMPALPTFGSMVFGFVVSLLFFVALGALMLGFMPKRLSRMRHSVGDAPAQTLLLGVIGLSMLFGMVPIIALTIVGLPFVLIVVLAIVVAWTLGYALGAYSVAMRVWSGLGGAEDPSSIARLMVFAAAIIFIALLNFIPFVGWVANYTLVLLGIGAMTRAVFNAVIGNPGAALDLDMKPVEN